MSISYAVVLSPREIESVVACLRVQAAQTNEVARWKDASSRRQLRAEARDLERLADRIGAIAPPKAEIAAAA